LTADRIRTVVSHVWIGVPHWVVLGVGIGLTASLCAACLFYVGTRWFPGETTTATREAGDDRRRMEIRDYLDAIDEPYAEDHPIEDVTVAFYLPGRDVAITFDPRAFYRLERAPTEAVLVEHELPGVHLGSRLPFETPEVDFGTDEAEIEPYDAAFEVLGVPADASEDQVRRAYRRRAKETHPDQGGDEAEFRRVREAYTAAREAAAAEEVAS
jgi:DnaJ-domain-containing protein 1